MGYRKLGRNSSARKALFRSILTSFFRHERIETTEAKAKEISGLAEQIITLAKRGDLSARRMVIARLMRKALQKSRHFTAPHSIKEIAGMAEKHISLGNMAGEGWFLTGEMLQLIKGGTPNIICLQPFGCLPNHISGKGMIRELLRSYPGSNIVAVYCDPSVSEVNQLNRIKLMLSVAKERKQLAMRR